VGDSTAASVFCSTAASGAGLETAVFSLVLLVSETVVASAFTSTGAELFSTATAGVGSANFGLDVGFVKLSDDEVGLTEEAKSPDELGGRPGCTFCGGMDVPRGERMPA
jgi:hypothetical protein